MEKEDLERKKVATEWDSAWFCDGCGKMMHWKTKAYIHNNNCYCENCADKLCNGEKVHTIKSHY